MFGVHLLHGQNPEASLRTPTLGGWVLPRPHHHFSRPPASPVSISQPLTALPSLLSLKGAPLLPLALPGWPAPSSGCQGPF